MDVLLAGDLNDMADLRCHKTSDFRNDGSVFLLGNDPLTNEEERIKEQRVKKHIKRVQNELIQQDVI